MATQAPDPASETARIFRDFAEREAHGHSPLYERLALAAAEDPAIHDLLDQAPLEQRRATLFFAAVHFLVARAGTAYPEDGRTLRTFCDGHRDALVGLIRTRRTQTNEPARSAQLLPALSLAAAGAPIALIEVGSSAGLNLQFDRYRYRFAEGLVGDDRSPLLLEPEVRGRPMPTVGVPTVGDRMGIDLDPIDVGDPEARAWLRACVWADQAARLERLDRAIELARSLPRPPLRVADATTELATVATTFAPGVRLVVVHSNTATYFGAAGVTRFLDQLTAIAGKRELSWVSAEGPRVFPELFPEPPGPVPWGTHGLLGLATWTEGTMVARTLARLGPHGAWIDWV